MAAKSTKLILPTDVRDELRALIHNYPDAYIQTTKVEDKGDDEKRAGGLVKFTYNFEQRRIAHFQRWSTRNRKVCRGLILKTRQKGVSTQQTRRNWVLSWSADNMLCITIAQREATAQSLIEKMRAAYFRLPPWMQWKMTHDTDYLIYFTQFLSKLWILSTEAMRGIGKEGVAIRGQTAHLIHITEWPLMPDFFSILEEILSFCHAVLGTHIIAEATGHGKGSAAHKFWKEVKEGKHPLWTPISLFWQHDPTTDLNLWNPLTNSNKPASEGWSKEECFNKMSEMWEYEPRLIDQMSKHNLTVGQLWYLYLYLRDSKVGNWKKLLEDMASDDDEAWQVIGEGYFDSSDLIKVGVNVKEIPFLAYYLTLSDLESGFRDLSKLQRADSREADAPLLVIYAPPEMGREYIYGTFSTTGNAGSDPAAGYMIDKLTGEMMCSFRGIVKPHQNGNVAVSLCKIFNNAILAPEVHSPEGVGCMNQIQRINYPRLYQWKAFDDIESKGTNKAGWYTGRIGGILTLNLLARVLEQSSIGAYHIHRKLIRDPGLITEMETFVDDPNTGPGPQAGSTDTRIRALSIAWCAGDMETRGWDQTLMDSLTPCSILTPGNMMRQELTVKDAIARSRTHIETMGGFVDDTEWHW